MTELANKLKDLIKRTPGILLVRLADQADCDVDAVHVELAEAIRLGEVLTEKTEGPNGHKTYAFQSNPAFLGWGKPAEATVTTVAAAAVALPVIAPPAIVNTAPAVPTETKVQIAIDYLQSHGVATSDEIHAAMGLNKRHTPQQYLGYAMKVGRIVRQGDVYRLGDGAGVKRSHRVDVTPPTPVIIPAFAASAGATLSVQPAQPEDLTQDAIAASMQVGSLQIMAWQRSGRMVLTAHGATLLLESEHVRALVAFVGLLGANHG
ncbi:MAG: hypothetical protein ABI171_01070 [Collimonas sp.]|uniref:hypothetical protein n=1 Tax=Collimonas sp. TaxID=1963772 RepID=UPI003267DC25